MKYWNINIPKSNMGVEELLKGPSSVLMTCSKHFRFDHNYVNRSFPKIILYLPLAKSSTWKSHVTTFIAKSGSKLESILTLGVVMILLSCVLHCIKESVSRRSISISIPIKIAGIHQLPNKMQMFLNFASPFLVFIHSCRICE